MGSKPPPLRLLLSLSLPHYLSSSSAVAPHPPSGPPRRHTRRWRAERGLGSTATSKRCLPPPLSPETPRWRFEIFSPFFFSFSAFVFFLFIESDNVKGLPAGFLQSSRSVPNRSAAACRRRRSGAKSGSLRRSRQPPTAPFSELGWYRGVHVVVKGLYTDQGLLLTAVRVRASCICTQLCPRLPCSYFIRGEGGKKTQQPESEACTRDAAARH